VELPEPAPAGIGPVTTVEPLTHNAVNAATGGIWRVRGDRAGAICKVFRPPAHPPVGSPRWQTSDEPTHWNYWRREYLAYTTGFASRAYAGTGIRPPALLDARERPDGAVVLWLAEVTGAPGMSWPVEWIADFAYRLGAGQARHAGRVPDEPWLSRNWLAQYVADRRPGLPDPVPWDHPAAAVWPDRVRAHARTLWDRRADLVARAGRAPRTLCHLDVWPMNLIADGPGPVLLDWAFVGEGGLGEDIANLIVDSFADGLMDLSRLPALAAQATDAYLAGLRAGGWSGPPDEIRQAVAAAGAAKYCWLAPALLSRAASGGLAGPANYDREASEVRVRERFGRLLDLLVDWAERVLR
jgi:hypothetical protein